MKYNVNDMVKQGLKPRVHGNGFIQIDLTETERLHIWGHPSIPRQSVSTPIHDHIFSFRSECIVGRIINIWYDIRKAYDTEFAAFEIHTPQVRDKEDTILTPTGEIVMPSIRGMQFFVPSTSEIFSQYSMHKGLFHETVTPEPTATVITKYGKTQAEGNTEALPRVLVPYGKEPDNNFNRYAYSEHFLWDIVNDVLRLQR